MEALNLKKQIIFYVSNVMWHTNALLCVFMIIYFSSYPDNLLVKPLGFIAIILSCIEATLYEYQQHLYGTTYIRLLIKGKKGSERRKYGLVLILNTLLLIISCLILASIGHGFILTGCYAFCILILVGIVSQFGSRYIARLVYNFSGSNRALKYPNYTYSKTKQKYEKDNNNN